MDLNQLKFAADVERRIEEDRVAHEGFRITCMLAGFKLRGIAGPGIENFLSSANIRREEWDAFLKYIRTPYMLSESEVQRAEEYFTKIEPLRHELVRARLHEVVYYGMVLLIPNGHRYVWVDSNKGIYSSDQEMKRDHFGFIVHGTPENEEEDMQSIEYVGYIKSNWDWFNFNQHCYTLLGDASTPVPEESENVD